MQSQCKNKIHQEDLHHQEHCWNLQHQDHWKALNPTSGNVNKSIVRRKFEYEDIYHGSKLEEPDLTAASSTYKHLTEKFYQAGSRVDEPLEPAPVPPRSPVRQRSTSVSSSFLNNAMIEVT